MLIKRILSFEEKNCKNIVTLKGLSVDLLLFLSEGLILESLNVCTHNGVLITCPIAFYSYIGFFFVTVNI